MFSIKNIVTISMMLSLLIISFLIKYFVPSLPNGLGNLFVLPSLIIILYSFVFGIKKTLIVGFIFYGVIAFAGLSIFLKSLTYAKNGWGFAGVYFLDYLFPFIVLANSSLIYFYKKTFLALVLGIITAIICSYFLNVLSGVIFWGQYSWTGYSVIVYSLLSNLIRTAVLLFFSPIIVTLSYERLQMIKNKYLKEEL